jgi:hypothetical protein
MRTHSPTCLEGPISMTRDWWRAAKEPPAEVPRPLFRAALVARVRQEIAAGIYETPEKWEAALDRLLARLEQEE